MSTVFLQRQKDITISTSSVEIRDISIVVPDCLLICNLSHAKVQLIDTRDGRVFSEVSMAYWINKPPMWRLCLPANDRAAVTVSNKIQMINIQRQSLSLGIVLKLNRDPVGDSTCGQGDLVVSYSKAPWIEVITTNGKVLRQFDVNTKHFDDPRFLTTSIEGFINVSDCRTNAITKLDSALQLLQTFSSLLMSIPAGITSMGPDVGMQQGKSSHPAAKHQDRKVVCLTLEARWD